MDTTLSLNDSTIVMGPVHPFVIIGERINPTRRKKLADAMAAGDFSVIQEEARVQAQAGAHVLDVNAGVPGCEEPALLRAATLAVMDAVKLPLCLDSANPDALAAALAVYPGKALINSTTAEEKMMDVVFPLAHQYGAAIIGVLTDDRGVPATARERLRTAENLIKRAGDHGIAVEDILIDPLALVVSADDQAARITLESILLIQAELGVNMCLGASNVSFGLPDRKILNAAFLALAVSRGLTSAITDPTVAEIQTALLACDLLMGHDAYSMRWIKSFRARQKAAAAKA
jgi:5-methyltetrahydrofolate--homocysteine methyltransferase